MFRHRNTSIHNLRPLVFSPFRYLSEKSGRVSHVQKRDLDNFLINESPWSNQRGLLQCSCYTIGQMKVKSGLSQVPINHDLYQR